MAIDWCHKLYAYGIKFLERKQRCGCSGVQRRRIKGIFAYSVLVAAEKMMFLLIIFSMLVALSMGVEPRPKLSLLNNIKRWLKLPLAQNPGKVISVSGDQLASPTTYSVSLEDKNKEFEENLHRVYPMLRNSLMKFYFFREEFGDSEIRMNEVIRCMEREEFKQSSIVINEGESADKLYIVEAGSLDVIIHGHYVRTIQASDMFGELALLYDAPRS